MLLTGREEREGKGMDCLLFNFTSGYGPGFYVYLKLFMFIANFWYYVVFCYLDTVWKKMLHPAAKILWAPMDTAACYR